ncbi:DUF624 domain-containing protein [Paractinoplanes durhamensis]|uniref:DUF624 domain-containing protein n=1 Tax=Paractinoplanes durhamensis TaxID=113563 RepID=UPI003641A679
MVMRFYEAADELFWAVKLTLLWTVFTLAGGVVLGLGPATLAAYTLLAGTPPARPSPPGRPSPVPGSASSAAAPRSCSRSPAPPSCSSPTINGSRPARPGSRRWPHWPPWP